VVKPATKTSFPTTELRGSYAPPFHVSLVTWKLIFRDSLILNSAHHILDFLVLIFK